MITVPRMIALTLDFRQELFFTFDITLVREKGGTLEWGVGKLVMLDPPGSVSDKSSFLIREVLFSLAGRRGVEAISRMVLGNQPIHKDAIKYMNLIMTRYKSHIERLIPFSDEELKQLTMPTLLILGKQYAIRDHKRT
jgi:hypothetical protein